MINEMTDFAIVNFPFLDDDVPSSTSYDVYISLPIHFSRVFSHVFGLNYPLSFDSKNSQKKKKKKRKEKEKQ